MEFSSRSRRWIRTLLGLATLGISAAVLAGRSFVAGIPAAEGQPRWAIQRQTAGGPHVEVSRRLLASGAAVLLCPAAASVAAAAGALIVVLGAGGGTGRKCVQYAAGKGYQVRACTRGGTLAEGLGGLEGVMPQKCSVTSQEELREAVRGSIAVVFAASASRTVKADDPQAVDYEGLINTAKACISAEIPRLVVVSSGAVSKPDSPVYKFLNVFGSIMEKKILGEDAVRRLYAADSSGATYTVIRPGGLTKEEPKGPSGIELNQGDEKSGRISRADLAALCVECIREASAADTTFECYERGTAQPLSNVGWNNIVKGGSADFQTGRERVGATWPELFQGLARDSSGKDLFPVPSDAPSGKDLFPVLIPAQPLV